VKQLPVEARTEDEMSEDDAPYVERYALSRKKRSPGLDGLGQTKTRSSADGRGAWK
jgi:hypothetical protein